MSTQSCARINDRWIPVNSCKEVSDQVFCFFALGLLITLPCMHEHGLCADGCERWLWAWISGGRGEEGGERYGERVEGGGRVEERERWRQRQREID